MTGIQVVLGIVYLPITAHFLINWLKFSKQKDNSSPEEMFLSLVVLMIVTLLWPLVLPISFIQSLKTKELQLANAVPVFLVIFIVGILTLSGLAASTIGGL